MHNYVDSEGEDGNLEDRIKKQVLYDLRKNTYHWTPIRYCDLRYPVLIIHAYI